MIERFRNSILIVVIKVEYICNDNLRIWGLSMIPMVSLDCLNDHYTKGIQFGAIDVKSL